MRDKIIESLRKLGCSEFEIGDELFWRGYELDDCQNDEQLIGWRSAKVKERWLLDHDPARMGER